MDTWFNEGLVIFWVPFDLSFHFPFQMQYSFTCGARDHHVYRHRLLRFMSVEFQEDLQQVVINLHLVRLWTFIDTQKPLACS